MKTITKYYSDILGKEFNSVEELEKAEEEKTKAEQALATTNNRKKELSKTIESADSKIETAQKEYADIRTEYAKKYKELKNEYSHKLTELEKEKNNTLSEKAKEIRQYGDERYDALCKYYKEFGTYKKYLTDKEAEQKRRKIINSLVSAFSMPNIWDMFINW